MSTLNVTQPPDLQAGGGAYMSELKSEPEETATEYVETPTETLPETPTPVPTVDVAQPESFAVDPTIVQLVVNGKVVYETQIVGKVE
jgi:hypothetical protein